MAVGNEIAIQKNDISGVTTLTKEKNISQVYEDYIDSAEGISQGIIARVLCNYIEKGPLYLPVEEGCKDPFIGRLVASYVWGDLSYNSEVCLSPLDWTGLWQRAQQFRQDPEYLNKALVADTSSNKQKIKNMIEKLKIKESYQKVSLGVLKNSEKKLSLESHSYDLYQFLGTYYMSLTALKNMGFKQQEKGGTIYLDFEGFREEEMITSQLSQKEIYLSNQAVYVGEFKTHTLETQEEVFVPVRALQPYFELLIGDGELTLTPKEYRFNDYVLIEDGFIENKTAHPITITYSEYYWNGSDIIEEKYEAISIPEKGKIVKGTELYSLTGGTYVTTVIGRLQNESLEIECKDDLGQNVATVLTNYQRAIQEKEKEKTPIIKEKPKEVVSAKNLFPESLIIGTMKYKVNSFQKGEKVELWASEDGNYHWVKDKGGKKVKIPWGSISIPKNPESAKDKPTNEQIEGFLNSKNVSSKTEYLVWTDLYRQQTYVFKGKKNDWQMIRTMLCSTGNNVTPTPRGEFELQNKVPYFGVEKGYRCKNAFQIFGDYLYHSVLFDATGTRLLSGDGKLGHRASHGCIRFSPEDSLWFYNTMKSGTKVWIN